MQKIGRQFTEGFQDKKPFMHLRMRNREAGHHDDPGAIKQDIEVNLSILAQLAPSSHLFFNLQQALQKV